MDIFSFGLGEEVKELSPEILGGKGAGLMWMTSIGVDVPPGFIMPCSLMAKYQAKPEAFMKQVAKEIKPYLNKLKQHFGYMPLVSVRSGARVSMPGMLNTILNVGLDFETVELWQKKLGDVCAENSATRLVLMYADTVHGLDKENFKRCKTVSDFYIKYHELTGVAFPDAQGQLLGAIEAVFNSWNNERAKFYRKMNNIPEDWGTAVTIQSMVFGNLNDQSGTGVLFTRNPDSGEDEVTGEFLVNAQGEDVVDGSHTPMPLVKMLDWNKDVASQLIDVVETLEKARGDVQDVEFTIQDGKLYVLQTRNAKRSPAAAVRIAAEMFEEGLIDMPTLFQRVSLTDYDKAQQVVIDPKFIVEPFAHGLAACTGVVTGKVVHSSKDAISCKEPVILVTQETTPDDIEGMFAAKGIITMQGGSTCHAAVVARGMNKPCVVGVGMELLQFPAGEIVSIDGATGRIWNMEVPVIDGSKNKAAAQYLATIKKILGYIPIIEDGDARGEKEVLYHMAPSSILHEQNTKNIIELLNTVDHLYIDQRSTRVDPVEKQYYQLFEDSAHTEKNTLKGFLETLTVDDRKKISLIGGVPVKGVHTITEVATIEDLILAEGEFLMTLKGANPEVLTKIFNWRQGEKFTAVSYASIGPKGSISFISDEQALQTR